MKINPANKNKFVMLYSLHVPLFLLIIVSLGVITGNMVIRNKHLSNIENSQNVLGEEDEDKSNEENKSDTEKKDKPEEEKSRDKNREETKQKENSTTKIEPKKEEPRRQATIRNLEENKNNSEMRYSDSQNENESETEQPKLETKREEEDSKETVELISTVTNPDGTITKTFRKTEGDKVELKALTYDSNGVLIKKAELNLDGTIKEEELVNENDREDSEEPKETPNKLELVIKSDTENPLDSSTAMSIRESINNLGQNFDKIELEAKTEDGKVKYEGTAINTEKLLGLFNVDISKNLEVDSTNGGVVSVNQDFWSKILDFFSF